MIIPKMTDPRGRYWNQPDRGQIEIDGTHALMTRRAFKQIPEYSRSQPTGVYTGKMWVSIVGEVLYLRWYGDSTMPNHCSVNQREILIA